MELCFQRNTAFLLRAKESLSDKFELVFSAIFGREAARFGELKNALGMSSTMLSERILDLERKGLEAMLHDSKIGYRLTASARELDAILTDFDRWWSTHHPGCQPVIAN
jgi:DNA-binding HxlR family transcriptional regulator